MVLLHTYDLSRFLRETLVIDSNAGALSQLLTIPVL